MRREWINEGKPHNARRAEPEVDAQALANEPATMDTGLEETSLPDPAGKPQTPPPMVDDDQDLYDATPQAVLEQRRQKRDAAAGDSLFISDDEGDAGGPPLEDELDALLAEDTLKDLGPSAVNAQQSRSDIKHHEVEDNFDDEMEAMAGMDDMW